MVLLDQDRFRKIDNWNVNRRPPRAALPSPQEPWGSANRPRGVASEHSTHGRDRLFIAEIRRSFHSTPTRISDMIGFIDLRSHPPRPHRPRGSRLAHRQRIRSDRSSPRRTVGSGRAAPNADRLDRRGAHDPSETFGSANSSPRSGHSTESGSAISMHSANSAQLSAARPHARSGADATRAQLLLGAHPKQCMTARLRSKTWRGPQPRGVHRLLSAAYEAADQAVKGVADLRTVSTYAAASTTAMS